MFCRTPEDVNATTSYRTSMQISNINQDDQDESFQFDIHSINSTSRRSRSRSRLQVCSDPPESEIQSSSLIMEGDESGLSTQKIFGERYKLSPFHVTYNGGIPMYDLQPVSNDGEGRERWSKGDICQVVFNNDLAIEFSTFVNTNTDTSNSTNVQGDPSSVDTITYTNTNDRESGRVTVEGWMFC